MLFNSFDFIIFFPAVLFVLFLIPRRARYIWLLITSYYFYMSWNPKYALLIATSTVITWLSGLWIRRCKDHRNDRQAKNRLITCLVLNFGILFVFKETLI